MEVFSKSDIGLVRQTNQDDCRFKVLSKSSAWAIVCDGMGGANGGNVASSAAVEYIAEAMQKEYHSKMKLAEISEMMSKIVLGANKKVYELSKSDPNLEGMGTTVEFVLVKDNKIHVVHVGDSRTYSIRGGKIIQITTDHSVVQEMVNRGEITEEEARVHPSKNYITRALGVNPELRVDYIMTEFNYGDVVLLCSDGLSNYLDTTQLIQITHEHRGNELTEILINTAKEMGGNDNITVVVIY
ncbi:MAG: Stp1/IreP family PP2C-type Ser/Thr phosphatase [Bacillota bacterium]|nr:Stp1/IreP family PP2C-type Ser/Thr phosphatase [Bacillota bacterium]